MLPCLVIHGLKLYKFVSRSDLVLILFWMLTMPWNFYPFSFYRRVSHFVAFQAQVAHLRFCLVRIQMWLLRCFRSFSSRCDRNCLICEPYTGIRKTPFGKLRLIGTDFREGDEDSNFSVFRVRRFPEWPGPLHWISFSVEILTKPLIHWIASPLFTEKHFHWKVLRHIPFPRIGSYLKPVAFRA